MGMKDPKNEAANAELLTALRNETDPKTLIVYGIPPKIVAFLTVHLTDDQIKSYQSEPAVSITGVESEIEDLVTSRTVNCKIGQICSK